MVDLSRIESLVDKGKLMKMKKKKVMICGIGGVGSFVAEGLARSGVGHLVLVDYDIIDKSNINRQIMVTKNNIGKIKVDELKKHLQEISDVKIDVLNVFIDDNFIINEKYDYVIDCIDNVKSKFHLVKMCHILNIPIICSLGSAKRISPNNIKYTKLSKTRNDPLAKSFRNLVKKEKYYHSIDVVYVDSIPMKTNDNTLGSTIFVTGSVGLYIASIVYQKLLNEL